MIMKILNFLYQFWHNKLFTFATYDAKTNTIDVNSIVIFLVKNESFNFLNIMFISSIDFMIKASINISLYEEYKKMTHVFLISSKCFCDQYIYQHFKKWKILENNTWFLCLHLKIIKFCYLNEQQMSKGTNHKTHLKNMTNSMIDKHFLLFYSKDKYVVCALCNINV